MLAKRTDDSRPPSFRNGRKKKLKLGGGRIYHGEKGGSFYHETGKKDECEDKRRAGDGKEVCPGKFLSQPSRSAAERVKERWGLGKRKSVQYHYGAVIRDITKVPSFQLTETHIRLEPAQCHLLLRL